MIGLLCLNAKLDLSRKSSKADTQKTRCFVRSVASPMLKLVYWIHLFVPEYVTFRRSICFENCRIRWSIYISDNFKHFLYNRHQNDAVYIAIIYYVRSPETVRTWIMSWRLQRNGTMRTITKSSFVGSLPQDPEKGRRISSPDRHSKVTTYACLEIQWKREMLSATPAHLHTRSR